MSSSTEDRTMAIFIDTGVFIALRNADDEFHTRGKELMKRVLKCQFGGAFTSDYVLDEAITTALVRTKRHDLALDIGKYIMESQRITKLYTTEETVAMAWKKLQTFKDKPMSFTDCVSLSLMEKNRIKQIMSFDSGLDGLTQRIC